MEADLVVEIFEQVTEGLRPAAKRLEVPGNAKSPQENTVRMALNYIHGAPLPEGLLEDAINDLGALAYGYLGLVTEQIPLVEIHSAPRIDRYTFEGRFGIPGGESDHDWLIHIDQRLTDRGLQTPNFYLRVCPIPNEQEPISPSVKFVSCRLNVYQGPVIGLVTELKSVWFDINTHIESLTGFSEAVRVVRSQSHNHRQNNEPYLFITGFGREDGAHIDKRFESYNRDLFALARKSTVSSPQPEPSQTALEA